MADDVALLDAWRQGDATAGQALFERHFDPIYRFLSRKLDRGVEDLVQRTFMKAMESAERFRGEASMRTYLMAIAHNALVDHFRAEGRRQFDPEVNSLEDLGLSPSSMIAERERDRLLLEALRRLPMAGQTILELFYWEGLSGDEIATVLGISPHTVRSRLHRARSRLREVMHEAEREPLVTTETDLEDWAEHLARLREKSAGPPSEDPDAGLDR